MASEQDNRYVFAAMWRSMASSRRSMLPRRWAIGEAERQKLGIRRARYAQRESAFGECTQGSGVSLSIVSGAARPWRLNRLPHLKVKPPQNFWTAMPAYDPRQPISDNDLEAPRYGPRFRITVSADERFEGAKRALLTMEGVL